MKNILIIILLLTLKMYGQTDQPTKIYLVRHAEKVTIDVNDKNPLLTKKGEERAKNLVRKLKKINLSAIYSSDLNRTKLTAKPISIKQKIEITFYDPKQLELLANKIIQEKRGENVLIVGHSNTLLETIEFLGGKRPFPSIADYEYNYLFVVTLNHDGNVEVEVNKYGKPNIKIEK